MAFKIQKTTTAPSVQKRLSIPGETWRLVEFVSNRDAVDPGEVVNQALAYALRGETKAMEKAAKEGEAQHD